MEAEVGEKVVEQVQGGSSSGSQGLVPSSSASDDDAQVLGEEAANRESEKNDDVFVSLHELHNLNHLALLEAIFEKCVFLCRSRNLTNGFDFFELVESRESVCMKRVANINDSILLQGLKSI